MAVESFSLGFDLSQSLTQCCHLFGDLYPTGLIIFLQLLAGVLIDIWSDGQLLKETKRKVKISV